MTVNQGPNYPQNPQQGYQHFQPPPQKKGMSTGVKILLGLVGLFTLGPAGCVGIVAIAASSSSPIETSTGAGETVESTLPFAGTPGEEGTEQPDQEPPPPTEEAVDSDLTPPQQNAVRSAEQYLEFSGFSRQGLIDQLSSEYGNQYAVEDATIAVDSLNSDWNEQAVRSAKSYLDASGFSCQGLIDQLSSEYGNQYTLEEATHGANSAGAC